MACQGVVTNYREGAGYKTGRGGGACEVLPLRKGGGEGFTHAEGGGGDKKCWGSFYKVA